MNRIIRREAHHADFLVLKLVVGDGSDPGRVLAFARILTGEYAGEVVDLV